MLLWFWLKKSYKKLGTKAINLYINVNIYNIDESVLFWKTTTDRILKTKQIAKFKHNKPGITIILTCNIIGPYKLEPWLVKKVTKPQYFERLFINIKNLQMI